MKLSEYIKPIGPSKFAQMHGIPVPVITRFLNKERGLSGKTMARIVEITGGEVSYDDLVAEFPNK